MSTQPLVSATPRREPAALQLTPTAFSPHGELVNAITHGIGLLLSLAGAIVLLGHVSATLDGWRLAGCLVFAITLVSVYAASTLSHAVVRPSLRRLFRKLDQGFIYLLIVSTYTPLALTFLRSGWWWWLFLAALWTAALAGFTSKIVFSHRIDTVPPWSYLLLAWAPILPGSAYLEFVPSGVVWLVLAGGLCYTVGVVFLILDCRRLHFHAIWHVFVIGGSLCHYLAIFQYVACGALL